MSRPGGDGSTVSLPFAELEKLIERLLSRKERGNGVCRALIDRLRWSSVERSHVFKDGVSGFHIRRSLMFEGRFELMLFGDVEALLARINREKVATKALRQSRSLGARRRMLKARGLWKEPKGPKAMRALPGASGRNGLQWHFRNHDLLFEDAVAVIARASLRSAERVRSKLLRSLDEQGVASFRVSEKFVIRLDMACVRPGSVDFYAPLELRTTDDNRHSAYRRLRSLLKERLDCVSRSRLRAKAAFFARKREETLLRLVA